MDTVNNKKPKRIIKSRPHTTEEKRKQLKEWKKRQKILKKAIVEGSLAKPAEPTTTGQEDSSGAHGTSNDQMKPSSSSANCTDFSRDTKKCRRSEAVLKKPQKLSEEGRVKTSETVVRPETITPEAICKPSTRPSSNCSSFPKDVKQSDTLRAFWQKPPENPLKMKTRSRGAVILQMAREANANSLSTKLPPPQSQTRNFGPSAKQLQLVTEASKTALKELNPDHLEYVSTDLIGSGSYGQCFRARYRGIDVLLKKMTYNSTKDDKERARKNLIHEAKVVCALGDHARLPMIFGVVTEREPLCLVTQFHGVNGYSVTLHQAANTDLLTPPSCTGIFLEICSALRHVHRQGYLHNDIKANNVVLEQESASEEYKPVLIDFGKSTKIGAVSLLSTEQSKKRTCPHHGKSYLAPEVLKERRYSAASDVYSLGRMLKAVSAVVGFYQKVRTLVKEATTETPSLRPHLLVFSQKLNAVQL